MMTKAPLVVIVGGGFGGLAVAKELRPAPVNVLLIDRSNHHVFQPLLSGYDLRARPPGRLLLRSAPCWPNKRIPLSCLER
jgi:NADH dehydrogenase